MKIGFLGMGSWGFCLASLLAGKGYDVVGWTTKEDLAAQLNQTKKHPLFLDYEVKGNITFTTDLFEALDGIDVLVESVTSKGIRPVFEKIKSLNIPFKGPIILTSKGIEQNSELILAEVVLEILGPNFRDNIGFLSGPSFAQEVIYSKPTSVVGTGFSKNAIDAVCETFKTNTFRVYPNADIYGVAFGGALKNVIAIACGISDGLDLGASAKAALMTRGLHEVRKLAIARGCQEETLNGLSGMGDIMLTCNSKRSRNFHYGFLLAQGLSPEAAEREIGMVVEGVYAAKSALPLSTHYNVPMPITEAVYKIVTGQMQPKDAVIALMHRTVKEESL